MRSVMGLSRIFALTLAALAFCLTSCGGGNDGGGGTIPGGTNAAFTPLSPTPANGSITMQPGSATADVFTVRVVATGVGNMFGTAFHVVFNPNSAVFLPPSDASGSVLNGTGTPFFNAVLQSPGNVAVVATRIQDQLGTVPGVSNSGDVIILTFRATASTTGNTFSFGNPRQVCNPNVNPTPPPDCIPISVVWSGGTLTTH